MLSPLSWVRIYKCASSLWHGTRLFPGTFTVSTDHYFVLRGTLTIETQRPNERHTLAIGERFKIRPGTAHRISNELESDCEFLLVQGVGKYDWHKVEAPEWPPITQQRAR